MKFIPKCAHSRFRGTDDLKELYILNTEQTRENIFTYIKTHYGETILAKIWSLKKTMIKCSSYTNHLRFSLCCHHNNILPKDLKNRIKTKRSELVLQCKAQRWEKISLETYRNILVHDVINLLY